MTVSALPRFLLAATAAAGLALPASAQVLISEFRFRGPNGANDEFVELYNPGAAAVDVSGWKINGSNNAGTTSTRLTIGAGVFIPAFGHFLAVNVMSGGYSGPVSGDATYTTGFTDDGGVALLDAASTIVDQVGLSAGSAYKEGLTLASLGASNLDRGYERGPGGSAGNATDTNNNASDFQLISPSQPQNLSAAPVPEPAGLALCGSCAAGAALAALRRRRGTPPVPQRAG